MPAADVRLLSVNVGLPRRVPRGARTIRTGIFKAPVTGRVALRTLNVEGDGQGDLRVHGGVDKAVYAYPGEHYPAWTRELGRDDLAYGQFGENLTVLGMLEDDVHVGDVYRVGGGARVQVTQPRVPCSNLGLRMGSSAFPKAFLRSGRVGFYLRVLQEGEIGAGDVIQRVCEDPARISIAEVLRLMFAKVEDREAIGRAAALPALSEEWRREFARRLARREPERSLSPPRGRGAASPAGGPGPPR
ncbi:MAG: MOSC domain-containing protein [Gemmatimonadota bacterium]